MEIQELLSIYSKHKGVAALRKICSMPRDEAPSITAVEGLQGSAAAVAFAALRLAKASRGGGLLAADNSHSLSTARRRDLLNGQGGNGNAAPTCPDLLGGQETAAPTCRPTLFVLNDEEEAGYFYHDLVQLLGDADVLFFPSSYRRAVKYARRDSANEILRTEVLNRLAMVSTPSANQRERAPYVVTYPAAMAERVAQATDYRSSTVIVSEGSSQDPEELGKKLLEMGFRRCDYVYEPGEFAVRGSIVDVFSYSSEYPYRIDFFGDDVESIRTFEVQTQLSRERQHDVTIVGDVSHTASSRVPFTDCLPADTVLVVRDFSFVHEMVDKIYDEGFSHQAEIEREGEEGEAIKDELNRTVQLTDGATLLHGLLPLQRIEIGGRHTSMPKAVVRFSTKPQPLFHKNFQLLRSTFAALHDEQYRVFVLADSAKQNERLRGILDELEGSPLPCPPPEGEGEAAPIGGAFYATTPSPIGGRAGEGAVSFFTPITPTLHEGFTDETLRLAVFTDHQIFDRFHKYDLHSDHARDAKMALTLKELMQFQPGDYVVHIDHGVGRFAGLVRVPSADGTMQEMIKLTYQNDDAVFVSIHALHKVSKYKGREGEPPRLSHLGTGAWEKLKERTKKKIKDIARDLISLYSRRREEQGFAFSPDSFMQHELEAGFAYEDTPDQLRVTQEVKADMERAQPMDRLVCGDVGFGKTEIAVRAALKAAADNKQVAVLVPTTVLALQHYNTFSSRLKGFPVRVDYLSRARTTAQSREILKDLADGKIDILVGTHKLISKSVKWHDLGLLIIDEEQKFGVSVKERLRQVKVNVDTLTMSATPIPRTLQFSLMGARDLSVIQTPPPNRRPIQTEVHTFSPEIVTDAVNFEMSRNGQVYIVTNRVAQLGTLAEMVHKYVPDARIATGHGQMPPAELEKIILGFVNYDYDVLISTTIVENGIDIPNANTIIIDAAQHFGLSDLHQMRGRVGRSNRKAFCYLLAPPLHLLPDDARRRLQAIENFSDLGSGIHIAMQDLDIRGAGNLLGAEQSGFIADLGYETYQKILSEAMSELKNESPEGYRGGGLQAADASNDAISATSSSGNATSSSANAGCRGGGLQTADDYNDASHGNATAWLADCSIECDLRAYLPETYVPGASERMLLYRELDGLTSDTDLAAYRRRLEDRFGPLPPEAEELLRVSPLRRAGRSVGAERLTLKNGRMTLYFVSNPDSPFYRSEAFTRIINYATTHYHRCALAETNGKRRMTIQHVRSVSEALDALSEMA